MNRRSLFRSLFGLAGAAAAPVAPVKAKEPDEKYSGGVLVFYYQPGDKDALDTAKRAAEQAGERYAIAMPRPQFQTFQVELAPGPPMGWRGTLEELIRRR